MSIKISNLQTFVAVAECGKLADAASRLHRTPSAVSMSLKSMETHLGRPLFEAERKSRLTPLGQYVLAQARLELAHFDRVIRKMERYARNEVGSLVVACVPTVSTQILPPVLKRFLETWPDIEIDVRDMDSLSVRRELERGAVELGIATPLSLQPQFDSTLLTRDAFGLICSRRHPLSRTRSPLTWRDIEPYPLIANPICEIIGDPEFQSMLSRSLLTVRNTTSILSLVSAGVGITVLPHLAVSGESPKVKFLPLAYEGLYRELHLMMRKDVSPTPVAEAFVETLVTEVGKDA